MFKIIITAAALLAVTVPARASPVDQDALALNLALDEMCRGWSGDDPHTGEACDARLISERLLRRLGYCFTGPGGGGHWRKVRPTDLHAGRGDLCN